MLIIDMGQSFSFQPDFVARRLPIVDEVARAPHDAAPSPAIIFRQARAGSPRYRALDGSTPSDHSAA
jgi:hypothetical protein